MHPSRHIYPALRHKQTRECKQHPRGSRYAHHHCSRHEHRMGREGQTPRLAPRRSATRRRDEATWTAHETRPLATRFGRQLKPTPVAVDLHSGSRSPPPSSIPPSSSLPSPLTPFLPPLLFPLHPHLPTTSTLPFHLSTHLSLPTPLCCPPSIHTSSLFPPARHFVYFSSSSGSQLLSTFAVYKLFQTHSLSPPAVCCESTSQFPTNVTTTAFISPPAPAAAPFTPLSTYPVPLLPPLASHPLTVAASSSSSFSLSV